HGAQVNAFYYGYYGDYCFLPLYVFCKEQWLVSYLRPSNIDGARHAWAVLALLVKALRRQWPQVRLLLRADSGFCRWKMFRWCEPRDVVTKRGERPQELDEVKYRARGEMENHVKAQQLDLFSDRTSCHGWWANQLRLLFSGGAYVLLEVLRRLGLEGTELAR